MNHSPRVNNEIRELLPSAENPSLMVRVSKLNPAPGLQLFVMLQSMNSRGAAKDSAAWATLRDFEERTASSRSLMIRVLARFCSTFPLCLAVVLAGCAHAPVISPATAGLDATLWVQHSAEYQATVLGVYRLAASQLEANLTNRSVRAMVEQTADADAPNKPPAVVLDIDETVLDNSAFQGELIRRGLVFTPALWADWVRLAKARALPGAAEFCQQAKAKGVKVIFITNRGEGLAPLERELHESITRTNLLRHGFPLDDAPDAVLTPGEREWAADKSTDKTARRKWVAGRYRVIALVGDDFGDFISVSGLDGEKRETLHQAHADRWGVTWFAIPNPAYGSWLRVLTKGTEPGDPAVLDKKRGQLRGFEDALKIVKP